MVADQSVDFVFSFDVFVHIKCDVVEEFLGEFARILKIGGKGFIHHSNLGAFTGSLREKLPAAVRKLLTKLHLFDEDHHRTPTMNAALFRALCRQHGLYCFKQEIVNWRGRRLIDCFSWFERAGIRTQDRSTEIVRNPNFMREAAVIRKRALMEENPKHQAPITREAPNPNN